MPRPEDMQCEAEVVDEETGETGRCSGQKTIDQRNGNWLRWCEPHQEAEVTARDQGGERVRRFVGAEPE